MSVHLDKELEALKKKILSLSALVEEIVHQAVHAFAQSNKELSQQVVANDDEIDLKEVEVEEECLKILALHQPVASQLRLVIATLKINNDLERVGDLAVNIAKRALYLIKRENTEGGLDFEPMSLKVRTMLKESLNSLVQEDTELAKKVIQSDVQVDQMHKETFKKVQKAIIKTPERTKELVNYLSVSRNLERIADYATNIAEDVLYMVDGSIVRHRSDLIPEE